MLGVLLGQESCLSWGRRRRGPRCQRDRASGRGSGDRGEGGSREGREAMGRFGLLGRGVERERVGLGFGLSLLKEFF